MLAILLTSLAPAISHALGSARTASWVEICTAQRAERLPAGTDESGGAPAVKHLLEHCPYCSIHVPALGMPPVRVAVAPVPAAAQEFPRAFLAAPRTLRAWVSAQPRAPPLAS